MFIFHDPQGHKIEYVGAQLIVPLICEKGSEYWQGEKGDSAIEWRSGQSSRFLFLTYVPELRWQCNFERPDRSWITAIDPEPQSGAVEVEVGGEPIKIALRETLSRENTAKIVACFMDQHRPDPSFLWEHRGLSVDVGQSE